MNLVKYSAPVLFSEGEIGVAMAQQKSPEVISLEDREQVQNVSSAEIGPLVMW
jgi:hypothetical protein